MINEERTLKDFGYNSSTLSYYSKEKVWTICSECRQERLVRYDSSKNLCKSCSISNGKKLKRGPFNIEYFNSVQMSINNNRINELKTFNNFGYYSIDLSTGSNKKVWRICVMCRKERLVQYNNNRALCNSCVHIGNHPSVETRCKISNANTGK